MTALIAAEVNGGRGVYAGPVQLQTIAKLVIASNCLWILIVNITKASILIQYLRIFSDPPLRRICYLFLTLLLPAASWALFAGIFLCTPTAKLWNPTITGHCISAQRYWLSVAGTDISLDFLILLLPLPAITALHLPRKQKIILVALFGLGFFVCAVSVVRLLTVLIAANQGHYVQSGLWAVIWSAVEANVGITCASLLSLKPLLVKIFPRLGEETQPPSHSMRLAFVESGADVWRDESTKVLPTGMTSSLNSPLFTRPSTAWSSRSGALKGSFSTGRPGGPQSAVFGSAVEGVASPQRAFPMRGEDLDLLQMLGEEPEEARARAGWRNSWFVEDV